MVAAFPALKSSEDPAPIDHLQHWWPLSSFSRRWGCQCCASGSLPTKTTPNCMCCTWLFNWHLKAPRISIPAGSGRLWDGLHCCFTPSRHVTPSVSTWRGSFQFGFEWHPRARLWLPWPPTCRPRQFSRSHPARYQASAPAPATWGAGCQS